MADIATFVISGLNTIYFTNCNARQSARASHSPSSFFISPFPILLFHIFRLGALEQTWPISCMSSSSCSSTSMKKGWTPAWTPVIKMPPTRSRNFVALLLNPMERCVFNFFILWFYFACWWFRVHWELKGKVWGCVLNAVQSSVILNQMYSVQMYKKKLLSNGKGNLNHTMLFNSQRIALTSFSPEITLITLVFSLHDQMGILTIE